MAVKDKLNRQIVVGDYVAHITGSYNNSSIKVELGEVIGINEDTNRVQLRKSFGNSWVVGHNCIITVNKEVV